MTHAEKMAEAMSASSFAQDPDVLARMDQDMLIEQIQALSYGFDELRKLAQLLGSIDQFKTRSVDICQKHIEIYNDE